MATKMLMQRLFNRFGYEVRRVGQADSAEEAPAAGVPVVAPVPGLYFPWYERPFQEQVFARVRERTVVAPDRCYILDQLARYAARLSGEFAECGVYKGGTAYLIADALRQSGAGTTLHLFDTFQGMPETADEDTDGHAPGEFGDTSLESVRRYLAAFGNICFHPGFLPDTFAGLENRRFAFVHVDVDLYQSVWDCCCFFYQRLLPGGVLVFDDYGFEYYRKSARRAADEFYAGRPEPLISLPTGQCLVIKL